MSLHTFEKRIYEIIPGFLTWTILLSPIVFTFFIPRYVTYFIILFDLYWLFRSLRLSNSLIQAYKKLKEALKIDWWNKLQKTHLPWQNLYHVVVLPIYNEGLEIVRPSVKAVINSQYDLSKVILVLAVEERGGKEIIEMARLLEDEFKDKVFKLLVVVHPDGIPGEVKGKGPNITYATKYLKETVIDPLKIPYSNVIITSIDSDAKVHQQFFAILSYQYLKTEHADTKLYQFVPMYHNNIWDAPAPMRVIAAGCSFWLLGETTRPERLHTFACYACSLKALVKTDYWDKTSIIEDGVQYWRNLLAFPKTHSVIPIYIPIYQDAVLDDKYWKTYASQYVQLRRWAWGASDLSLIVPAFRKNKDISWHTKLIHIFRLLDTHLSWSTAPLLLLISGWLPLLNQQFSNQVLAYNLPFVTSMILTLTMLGISASVIISLLLLPKDPHRENWKEKTKHVFQWALAPFVTIIFGAIPAIDSQTRLMLGKRLEFVVTTKKRKFLKTQQATDSLLT